MSWQYHMVMLKQTDCKISQQILMLQLEEIQDVHCQMEPEILSYSE